MKNKKILTLFSFAILLFSASCKRQKIVKTTIEEKTSMEETSPKIDSAVVVKSLPEKKVETPKKAEKILVQVNDFDFNYLKLKSQLHFQNESTDQTANANFHIKKDSAIWFSINKLVEFSRGVITQDSIHFFALDPKTFKRNYYDLSIDSLSQQFNFKLDFKFLQALIVGNMPIKLRDIDSTSMAGNDFLIRQNEQSVMIDNLISGDNHKLKKLIAKQKLDNGQMTINYDNFLIISNLLFPKDDAVEILSQKDGQPTKTNISLQHSQIEPTNENPGFVFKRK